MQRSTSKLLARAGSLRNINRTGHRFRFTVRAESLEKVHTARAAVLTWQRSGGTVASGAGPVDSGRVARFGDDAAITQDVVLYRRRGGGTPAFETRVYKLAVRADAKDGRAIARIELDFADFAAVPSFSKRVAAVMSHGGRLVMTVSSTFEGVVGKKKKQGKKKTPASEKDGSEADSASCAGDLTSDDCTDSLDGLVDGVNACTAQNGALARKAGSNAGKPGAREESPTQHDSPNGSVSFDDFTDERAGAGGDCRSRSPRRAGTRVSSKTNGVAAHEGSVERDTIERLSGENEALRKRLADVTAQLGREPVYKEVVRELRETKMALAMLTLEKDKLVKEMRGWKEAAREDMK